MVFEQQKVVGMRLVEKASFLKYALVAAFIGFGAVAAWRMESAVMYILIGVFAALAFVVVAALSFFVAYNFLQNKGKVSPRRRQDQPNIYIVSPGQSVPQLQSPRQRYTEGDWIDRERDFEFVGGDYEENN